MASSAIVIKVKYGETLRRFSASIQDKKLVLDTAMLRAKIRNLFNFDSNVEFTLTYVDEDGDSVTLADDDDLHDVVRQSLNPLRITVNLTNKATESSKTSTPVKSPKGQPPIQALNSGLSELLKSVPEPLRESITKLPLDLASKASKASSSTPALAELVETMKALYLSHVLSTTTTTPTASNANDQNGKKSEAESSTVKNSKVVETEAGSSNSKKVVNNEAGSCSSLKKKDEKARKVTSVKFVDVPPPRPVDLNVPYFEYEAFPPPAKGEIPVEKNKETHTTDSVEIKKAEKKKDVSQVNPDSFTTSPLDYMRYYCNNQKATEFGGSSSAEFTKPTNDYGGSSVWADGLLNATNQCPFVGLPLPNDSSFQGYHLPARGPHGRRFHHGNGVTFHKGVRCDGCGVHPITGPRYKSKVKEDYDLCSVCFAGMGNVADYIRMDLPASVGRHRHMPFKGFHDSGFRIPPPTLPHALRAPGSKLPRSKLDSRFILDVNVLDGTIMAPFTAFTKIWRMRNNGSVMWPRGSQLLWIGGDRLSNTLTADIEIPADGLPVDKELDIAVDFSAPELPGRYISYWRMASPTGQKFGQRVWVLIQVDASMKDLGETSINLNLPPVMRNTEVVGNHEEDAIMDNILPGNSFIKVTESEDMLVDSQPKESDDQEMNFPINDSLIINNGGSSSSNVSTTNSSPSRRPSIFNPTQVDSALASLPPISSPWSSFPVTPSTSPFFLSPKGLDSAPVEALRYPTVDSSEVLPTVVNTPPPPPPPTVPVVQPGVEEVKTNHEQILVKELEDMGFKQLDLNKEILRMNNYDLEKSIDDLCGVAEWDPMLEELQEMGFADNEANRRLLKKNNGSIKRVVMDLINGERA